MERDSTEPSAGPVASGAHGYLIRQLEMAWQLASYHLDGLSTEECLWRPADAGLHVHQTASGAWRADWPEHEGYDLGPPSIAWLTWHMGFWWSMVIDHSFGDGALARESVAWPGNADDVRAWLGRLQEQWRGALDELDDDALRSSRRTRWPFQDRPFGDVVAWANVELMKNAAEIGYARFLHARRPRR
ncbi:DinB family protein [Sorangium sp. So ce1335]|uniref:DinB family protein n=1 Tax=Sorangium sp. So ce1335 TaxID=3133335 RepID=UPI003F5F424F